MPARRFVRHLLPGLLLALTACRETSTPTTPLRTLQPSHTDPLARASEPWTPVSADSSTESSAYGGELRGCTPIIELLEAHPQTSVVLHVTRRGTAYLAYDVRERGMAGIYLASDATGSWMAEFVTRTASAWVDGLQTDASGGLHLLYTDVATSRVMYAQRKPGGAWSTSAVGQGHGAALVIDAAGTVHVVHRSPEATGARYARRVGGVWLSEPVDAATASSHVSLALDGQGRPHVAYVGSRSTQLFHAVRDEHGWTRTLVANRPGSATFQGVSLAFGPGDAPAMAAVTTEDRLYLAERTRGTWHMTPVLEGVDYLRAVSLAIDAGGNHHVGYMRGDYAAAYATNREGPWRHLPLLASSFAPASLALTPASQPVLGVLSSAKGVLGLARPCSSRAARPLAPPSRPSAPTTRGLAAP